ncbi:hypothetical protein ACIPSE_01410 [Streptomyces sp. NPDC090106]|uniref:hypothetical protein n=1 Tax=Streptomyces sp. NPDC090106 TaxID=3365946 RepID=UPI00381960C9
MSEQTRTTAWVGDQVHDSNAGREGIVTDIRAGTYVLRPLHSWTDLWTAPDVGCLEITVSREERLRRREEEL